MQDDRFEWDDAKARGNLKKHKISFEAARRVFDDPDGIDVLDTSEDYGEDRINRTGRVNEDLVTVTFVEREGRVRIISARKATRNDQAEYYASQA